MGDQSGNDFSHLLRRARRAAGLTQEELAERAGLSVRAISDLERGINRTPRRDTLDLLGDALELTPEERRQWGRFRRQSSTRSQRSAERDALAPTTYGRLARDSSGGLPATLPTMPTRFFGRANEIERLKDLLTDPNIRLVTLTGPGGSGKTRLAVQVATQVLGDFKDGTFFVDLAPVSDPDLVAVAMASTLGLRPRADQPVLASLSEWLQGKKLMLILDNFEQLLDAAPTIGDIVGRCPDLRMLATSRAPLRVRAEREFPVPPLPLPSIDDGQEVDTSTDALQLFVDRAQAVRPNFEPGEEETLTVARICRRLDGLPLAIELAAACVRLFPPRAILDRLEQNLPLTAGGPRDAPARQRTLHDTIAWSYGLLTSREQALLRRLSVFKGGWTIDAAEAVGCYERGEQTPDVLQATETLLEHSLIQSQEWLDGTPRFTMLETIREFGLAQLDAQDEREETHRRHAEYFVRLTAGARERLQSAHYRDFLERGDAEVENFRTALAWAIDHAPPLAVDLGRQVGWYLLTRGSIAEAQRWLEQALDRAGEALPDDVRALTLLDIATCANTYGDFETTRRVVPEAQAIFERTGDRRGIARSISELARMALWSGDAPAAVSYFEDSITRFRHVGYVPPVNLANLGSVLQQTGQHDRAARVLTEAIEESTQRDNIWTLAVAYAALSRAEEGRGDLTAARAAQHQSLLVQQQLRDPRYIAQDLENCVRFLIDDEPTAVARLLGAASRIRERIGVPLLGRRKEEYEQFIAAAQTLIGEDAWESAWSEGRSIAVEDVLEDAIRHFAN